MTALYIIVASMRTAKVWLQCSRLVDPARLLILIIATLTLGCQSPRSVSRVLPEDTEEGKQFLESPACPTTYGLVMKHKEAAVPLILTTLDRLPGETNVQTRCQIIQGALWKTQICTNSFFYPIIQRGSRDPSELVQAKTAGMIAKVYQYNLPTAVWQIVHSIQTKSPDEVKAAIVKQLGAPQRDIGSGLHIEQWDLPEGVLTFHPGLGPTFIDSKTKRTVWLMRTRNHIGENLFQSYEMTTVPDPKNYGNCFWLGNLKINADMTYQFKDSGQNTNQRNGQGDNYFMR